MSFRKTVVNKCTASITTISMSILLIIGCQPSSDSIATNTASDTENNTVESLPTDKSQPDTVNNVSYPMTIKHQLGDTVLTEPPKQVVALSMNEADFLDQLNVPIAGMVKDFVPHFLSQYQDDANVQDLGSIVQPNMERVYATKPDLILITPLQARSYSELAQIAPTLHFDINYENSNSGNVAKVEEHLLTLGNIFGKEVLAQQKVEALETQIAQVKQVTKARPEKALVVLHNNGAFSNFGTQSRYGFVFSDFGVTPASTVAETSLHGEPISSEFIQRADPDILYIVDRTAVMEHRDTIDIDTVSNPLLEQTKAWKNGKVVFVDADAWYTTAASPSALMLIMEDVMKGYE